jgi:hypothetical protein
MITRSEDECFWRWKVASTGAIGLRLQPTDEGGFYFSFLAETAGSYLHFSRR